MQLKKYFKISTSILIIFIFIYLIKNLGFYFDITKEPSKADIIICLGGGNGERLQKAIKLLKKNYSKNNKIILTSKYKDEISKKHTILIENNINKKNIITTDKTSNTLEELLFAKKILDAHNYNSINIISTNAHSKRISLLIKYFIKSNNSSITYNFVGTNPDWWNKEKYYTEKKAVFFVLKEFLKIIYNLIFYTLDNNLKFTKNTTEVIYSIKINFLKTINYIEKII